MSVTTIEELRKNQEFVPWDHWPNEFHTNCIAYALGLPVDDPKHEFWSRLLVGEPIEALETALSALGLSYRRVTSLEEIEESEYGIVLYHYFYKTTRKFFGCEWTEEAEEVHLARIELDGTWSHKFGWDYDASTTTPEEIHAIILRDDSVDVAPTAFFAVH